MKSKIIIALLLSVICNNTQAQQNSKEAKKVKKVKITDIYLQLNNKVSNKMDGSLANFKKLAPQSQFLQQTFTGFSKTNNYYGVSNASFSPSIALQFANKNGKSYRANPTVRLGLNAYNTSVLGLGYNKSESYVVDTFVSQQTGQKYVLDSMFNENYYMQHRSSQLEFNADIIFRTKQKTRWSVYGGVGFSIGTGINSLTNITNYKYSSNSTRLSTEPATNNSGYYGNGFGRPTQTLYNSEVIDSKVKTTTANIYLPLGIDFRIGNKREFWKKMHLFMEMRPGISYTNLQGIQKITDYTRAAGLGLRVNWR